MYCEEMILAAKKFAKLVCFACQHGEDGHTCQANVHVYWNEGKYWDIWTKCLRMQTNVVKNMV